MASAAACSSSNFRAQLYKLLDVHGDYGIRKVRESTYELDDLSVELGVDLAKLISFTLPTQDIVGSPIRRWFFTNALNPLGIESFLIGKIQEL